MTSARRGVWEWGKRRLHEAIVRARLRAQAERARPLWQRFLRDTLRTLLGVYVAFNLLLVFWFEIGFAWQLEYRVTDAATGAPVAGALVCTEAGQRFTTDVAGNAMSPHTQTTRVWWGLPAFGWRRFDGKVHVEADGYRAQDVQVGEQLGGIWVNEPHGIVAVRLQR